jgi:hypothetical protein
MIYDRWYDTSVIDVVDGSSTGAEAPRKWLPIGDHDSEGAT